MHNLPIIRTVSAALACLGLVAQLELARTAPVSGTTPEASPLSLCLFFVLGFFYTQLIEYLYHRIPMHRGVRFLSIGENIKRNHNEHHRRFHGESFRTKDPEMLQHIAGRYWPFPILFLAHYAVLMLLLPTALLLAFLTAAVFHYALFEATHWFTHVEDNAFDKLVSRIPYLADVRRRQIQHHRWHHEFPEEAFNFIPPYLFDFVTTGKGVRSEPLPPVLLPQPVVAAPVEAKPLPWQRALVRYGSVAAASVAVIGVAILAHGYLSSRGAGIDDPSIPVPNELTS